MDALTFTFCFLAVISIGVFIYGHTKSGKEWIKNW